MSTANNIPNRMIQISPNIYREVASILHKEIGKKSYYSGRIEGNADGYKWQLICTVIIHRDKATKNITEVVPVWWELHTYNTDGKEQINDFNFSKIN